MAKRKISAALALMLMTLFMTVSAECATGMISQNGSGDIYITQTGWTAVNGAIYYVHATKSQMYDKHEACRNTFRWRGDKLYYFGNDGRMITRNTRYIKLNSDNSVKYIYTAGTGRRERYNPARKRYQEKHRGKWHDTGNQTNIWWRCDWQL
jgi:hypothetical protein